MVRNGHAHLIFFKQDRNGISEKTYKETENMVKKYGLQLFAEGGEGAAEAAGSNQPATGMTEGTVQQNAGMAEGSNQPTTGMEQAAGETGANTEGESFEDLIKGKYAKDYNAKVSEVVNKRLKNAKAAEKSLERIQGGLMALGEHYGLNPESADFYDALNAMIMDDEKLYEDEALERGLDVKELKQIKKLERDNRMLRQRQAQIAEETQKRAFYDSVMQQVPQVQAVYNTFDIDAEMANPQFFNLVKNGVSLQNAYEVLHHTEMQAARDAAIAERASQQIAQSIANGSRRPNESGMNQNPASGAIDVSKMSADDFRKVNARAARGEKISFR